MGNGSGGPFRCGTCPHSRNTAATVPHKAAPGKSPHRRCCLLAVVFLSGHVLVFECALEDCSKEHALRLMCEHRSCPEYPHRLHTSTRWIVLDKEVIHTVRAGLDLAFACGGGEGIGLWRVCRSQRRSASFPSRGRASCGCRRRRSTATSRPSRRRTAAQPERKERRPIRWLDSGALDFLQRTHACLARALMPEGPAWQVTGVR